MISDTAKKNCIKIVMRDDINPYDDPAGLEMIQSEIAIRERRYP